MAGLGFPFVKTPNDYIKTELEARRDSVVASRMKPWIKITSNLGPKGYTLSSLTYEDVFGTNGGYNTTGLVKYKPKPIVTEFSIDFASRGTLRKGTFKISCFSLQQFEEMQKYFMEPGISIFVQWGWNKIASTNKDVYTVDTTQDSQLKYYRKGEELNKLRDSFSGCYDNMLGIISKAESGISNEEFTITTKIVSLGEILYGSSTAGVTTEAEETQWEKNATHYSTKYINSLYAQSDESLRAKINYCHFFNALPDQFRTKEVKIWGLNKENIDPDVDFINYDESKIEAMKSETSNQSFWNFFKKETFTFLEKKFKAESDTSPVFPKKYLKFSTFIKLLNFTNKSKIGRKDLFDFNIDIGTREEPKSIANSFWEIFSVDESVFIPNSHAANWFLSNYWWKSSNGKNTPAAPNLAGAPMQQQLGAAPAVSTRETATIPNAVVHKQKANKSVSFPYDTTKIKLNGVDTEFEKGSVGWIGDVYIEHEIAMEALKNVNGDIKDTLDSLLNQMSRATDGMWAFQLITEDENTQVSIKIVDSNVYNKKGAAAIKPLEFYLHGAESVFLSADFNFDIPKGMANRVVMLRANPETRTTETGLRSLFSDSATDIVLDSNQLKKENTAIQTRDEGNTFANDTEKARENWEGFVNSSKLLLQPSLAYIKGDISDFDIDKYLLPGISDNTEILNSLRRGSVENGLSSYSGALPIKIKFTILGISGFRFGDLITIKGLPDKYKSPNGAFMVTETTHKVDNKMWTTEVDAQFRPFVK